MKTKLLRLSLIFLLTIGFISCSKDDDSSNAPTTQNSVGAEGFSWRENDPNSTTVQTAASASFSNQYKTIIAKDASGKTIFEINLTGTTAATYSFVTGSGNALVFTTPTPFFEATSGDFIITSNANGKLSGTFTAFRSGTGITRLYGTVKDIPVN